MHANRFRAAAMVVAAFGVAVGVICTLLSAGGSVIGGGGPPLDRPYLEIRETHRTELTERMRAPGSAGPLRPPAEVKEVRYPSGELRLKAWFVRPASAGTAPVPAIVYLHGGFTLGKEDLDSCKPFLDAGYAVLLPTFRGEHDNPGDFEMLYGEVEDARAAVAWLARQDRIDKTRLYAFGHSIGGGIAALLSLWDSVPVQATGSAGGLFPYTAFTAWSNVIPFDRRSVLERQLRLLLGNTAEMKLPHYAYLGSDDELKGVVPAAEAELARNRAPLHMCVLDGDHMTSLPAATRRFLRDIAPAPR